MNEDYQPIAKQDIDILVKRLQLSLSKHSRNWYIQEYIHYLSCQNSQYIFYAHEALLQKIHKIEKDGVWDNHYQLRLYTLLKDIYGPLALMKDRLLLPDEPISVPPEE